MCLVKKDFRTECTMISFKINHFIFFILVTLSISHGGQCPDKCKDCDWDTNGQIKKAVCHDVQIQTLPNSLKELWTSDALKPFLVPLGKFQSYILASKTELRILSIRRYNIRQLSSGSFNICPNLIVLDLSDNLISNLPVDIFHGLTSLMTLNLSKNELKTLDSSRGLFSDLHSLTHLYLGFNKLTKISNSTFRNMTRLSQLDLDSNRISTIDIDTFQAMPSLQTINLSNNTLTNIQSELFKGLTKLLRIEVNGNLLHTLDPSSIIESSVLLISLSSNKFTEIPTSFLQHLQNVQIEVNLAENQIHNISRGSLDQIHVQKLNLSFNLIEFIQHTAFSDCTISELDLRHNHLKSLQKEMQGNFLNIKTMLLDNNTWTCDCSLLWLVEFIKHNQSDHSNPVCAEPVKYNGKTMISIETNLLSDCVPTTNQQSTSTQKIMATSSLRMAQTMIGKFQTTTGKSHENTYNSITSLQIQPTPRLTTIIASNFTSSTTSAKLEICSSSTEAHDSSSTTVGMIVGISVGVISLIVVTTALVKLKPWKKIGRSTKVGVHNVEL